MEVTEKEAKRFHQKYVIDPVTGCWNWSCGKFEVGYGMFHRGRIGGKKITVGAHRLSWMLHNGQQIPDGMLICHTCDNRLCVNPEHLYLGTYTDNNRDTASRNRANRKVGSKCSWSKLTEDQVIEILTSDYGRGANKAFAEKFGVAQSQVSHIRSGKRWGHLKQLLKNG